MSTRKAGVRKKLPGNLTPFFSLLDFSSTRPSPPFLIVIGALARIFAKGFEVFDAVASMLLIMFEPEVSDIHFYSDGSRNAIAFVVVDVKTGGILLPISPKMIRQNRWHAVELDCFDKDTFWYELKVDTDAALDWVSALAEGLELVNLCLTT
jgi:hypothetical protein